MKKRITIAAALLLANLTTMAANAQTVITGVTEFGQQAELHSMATGVIEAVHVNEGDTVTAGDVLVEVEDAVQTSRVIIAKVAADARAPIVGAQADLKLAQSRLARIDRAVKRGGAAKWELAEATLAVTAAEARLVSAEEERAANEARLALETASLAQFAIKAPFDGQVVEIQARAGELANGRDGLLTLVGGTVMKIVAFLPAERIADLAPGTTTTASLGVPMLRDVEVRLAAIDPRIEPGSATARVVFEFDNTEHQSPAGVEATISLPEPE